MSLQTPRRPHLDGHGTGPQPASQPRARMSAEPAGASVGAQPIRHPDVTDTAAMSRRGWWLLALNLLIPGSAQVLAGDRRLGRVGLTATLLGWLVLLLGLVLVLTNRAAALTVATNGVFLTALQIVVVGYLILWAVLTVDTIRLARLPALPTAARIGVPAAALAVTLLLGTVGLTGVVAAGTARSTLGDVFTASGPVIAPVDGRYNFLLIGADSGADRAGMRTDSLNVVSVNATTGEATMLGLTRELHDIPFPADSPMAAIYPDGYDDTCIVDVCKLNSIYTEVESFRPELYPDAAAEGMTPGIAAVMDAVTGITGLTLHGYVMVDMAGFARIVNILGGVTINVEKAVPIWRDDFTWASGYIGPGVVHMDGATALLYARERHSGSDYERMQRQRQLQEALLRQFTPEALLASFQQLSEAGREMVRTNIPQGMVGTLLELAAKSREYEITQAALTPDYGIDPEHPNWDDVRELVLSVAGPVVSEP